MTATRGNWGKTAQGWRRMDGDGFHVAIVPASSPTHPYLWAVYPPLASQPARCGYAQSLDEALCAADTAGYGLGREGYE